MAANDPFDPDAPATAANATVEPDRAASVACGVADFADFPELAGVAEVAARVAVSV